MLLLATISDSCVFFFTRHGSGYIIYIYKKKKVPPETGESYIFKKDKIKNEYFCGNMKSKTNAPLYIYT